MLIIIAFVGWKEPRDNHFLTIPTDCRGVRYANLWETKDLEHENLSNMVFYMYYQMLYEVIQKTPRITNEVIDAYSKKVWFLADMHQIWIKPHGIKKFGWYASPYRMIVEDVEQIIKEWPEEWKNIEAKCDDDIESEKDPKEPPPDLEKGKEKLGDKRKPSATKLAPRKKLRLLDEPAALHLASEEVEGLVARIQEKIDQPITKMVTAQTAMRSIFQAQFIELRSMVEKVAQSSLTTPSRSESGVSHPETSKPGKTRIVKIQPTMISLPTGVKVIDVGPIDIDLARIPLKTLNLVQREVATELQEREQATYQANEELRKTTRELKREERTLSAQAEQRQKEEAEQEQAIATIYAELPNCPIDQSTPLAQKFKIVASCTKELERYIEKMDAEHQRRIVELEARQSSMPPEERKARAVQMKAIAEQMEIQVTACQTLLEKTTVMQAQMEDIPTVVDIRRDIQGAQEKLTKINEEIGALTPLQKLVRLKETRHLQEDIQTL